MTLTHPSGRFASPKGHRRRFVPLVWAGSLTAIAVLALSASGTLSAFTASIQNSVNSAGTGSIVMEESSGGINCFSSSGTIGTNSSTCATINKFGFNLVMVPGVTSAVTVPVVITDTGTSPVTTSFTLTPTACVAAAGSGTNVGTDLAGFCGKVDVSIWDATDNKCIVGPAPLVNDITSLLCVPSIATDLTALGTTALNLPTPFAAGTSNAKTFNITTAIDGTATNADMNLQVADTLTWAFSA